MKTKTLTILFALVMALSMTAGVFAGDFDETWDENTVLTVFSDIDMIFPDLFADIDSDFLWVSDGDTSITIPSDLGHKDGDGYAAKDITLEDLEAKAIVDADNTSLSVSYDPCGDGLVKFDLTLNKGAEDDNWYGPSKTFYIRDITATVADKPAFIKKCTSSGGDDCRSVKFNGKGVAHVTGYLYVPEVMDATETYDGADVKINVTYSRYMTPFMDVAEYATATVEGSGTLSASKNNYCQSSLVEFKLGGLEPVRAKYDENTGEARFQATIINDIAGHYDKDRKIKTNYVIPADVLINTVVSEDEDGGGDNSGSLSFIGEVVEDETVTAAYYRYTDYTCKYTLYNVANAAPRTDYCKFGEGIAVPQNAVIRFDITIDHLDSDVLRAFDGGDIPFVFRVGGMPAFVANDPNSNSSIKTWAAAEELAEDADGNTISMAKFVPTEWPCPAVTRISVMDPLKPFMTFFGMESDAPIEPSGAYGVYEGGLWGMYQKCGKFAYMAVRLKNDGIKDEVIDLNNVAVAVNGGTPISWNWVTIASTNGIEADDNSKVTLEPGDSAVFIGRAKVTDIPAQLNSDIAMTGAVNFLDYGFYVTGKVYSDHNNTNCTVAP